MTDSTLDSSFITESEIGFIKGLTKIYPDIRYRFLAKIKLYVRAHQIPKRPFEVWDAMSDNLTGQTVFLSLAMYHHYQFREAFRSQTFQTVKFPEAVQTLDELFERAKDLFEKQIREQGTAVNVPNSFNCMRYLFRFAGTKKMCCMILGMCYRETLAPHAENLKTIFFEEYDKELIEKGVNE